METKGINTESFVMYESFYKHLLAIEKSFGSEKAYQYAMALNEFGLYGVYPEDERLMALGFDTDMTVIAKQKEKRQKAISDGSKGGRPQIVIDENEYAEALTDLGTYKAVAEHFKTDEDTLRKIRKENNWDEKYQKTEKPKNLNVNGNVNGNNNVKGNEKSKVSTTPKNVFSDLF